MPRFASREGQWFAVPLDDDRFARGVVARDSRSGVLLCYFFGPAQSTAGDLDGVRGLRPDEAVLVAMVSHLGLLDGTWPVIAVSAPWNRDEWPTPRFVRREELSGRAWEVVYDDRNPNRVLSERALPGGVPHDGAQDGLMGALYAQRRLTKLLTSPTD